MIDVIDGTGVTKERLQKSKIKTAPRVLTRGGLVLTYGQYDTEHCALDYMLNKGFIESYHYDAGYQLRSLYYSFHSTGRWIMEGGKAHEGDEETEKDRAEMEYHEALNSIDPEDRNITRAICIEVINHIPADYIMIRQVTYGLERLLKHFKKDIAK